LTWTMLRVLRCYTSNVGGERGSGWKNHGSNRTFPKFEYAKGTFVKKKNFSLKGKSVFKILMPVSETSLIS